MPVRGQFGSRGPAAAVEPGLAWGNTTTADDRRILWAFAWGAPEGRRHFRAFCRRGNGIEYDIPAHGPEATWPETAVPIRRMLDDPTP